MNTFKFNFNVENNDGKNDENNDKEDRDLVEMESFEIFPNDNVIKDIDNMIEHANIYTHDDLEIGYIYSKDAIFYWEKYRALSDKNKHSNNVFLAESMHTDLIEGKYEGGLKIWECTIDMINYIYKNPLFNFTNSKVLDLGCGMGMLGILALLSGAEVHFQDYNEEVICGATIPNVLLNLSEDERDNIKTRCKFFTGDWTSFNSLMSKNDFCKYDYILTSETIYNVKNYGKIYKLIASSLNLTGCALIGAKSHYFGVGGGTRQFESYVKENSEMKYETCWKSENGLSREIIKLSFN